MLDKASKKEYYLSVVRFKRYYINKYLILFNINSFYNSSKYILSTLVKDILEDIKK